MDAQIFFPVKILYDERFIWTLEFFKTDTFVQEFMCIAGYDHAILVKLYYSMKCIVPSTFIAFSCPFECHAQDFLQFLCTQH